PSTAYTAIINLAPKAGYTLVGVPADAFAVAGAAATNPAGSGTITAVFPTTGPPPAPPVDKTALEEALDRGRAVQQTHQTQPTWDALQIAIRQGAAAAADPAATQAEVDAATQAINDAIAALRYNYPVLAQFPDWAGSGASTARVDADSAKFTHLTLNSATVPATAYTVTSFGAASRHKASPLAAGDTAITLHEAYLETLTPGVYSFYAEFTDGASGPLTITISQAAKPGEPSDTGATPPASDSALPVTGNQSLPAIALLAALLLVSGVLLRAKTRIRTDPPTAP
ncbi:MAG: hypothetical protein LBD51_02255, partial [Bifidobacteriaceae bacterium]|nr:hypothetical protein [Bifidobacteriaceae bacterium]